jgi:diaminopimelate decarboxylase
MSALALPSLKKPRFVDPAKFTPYFGWRRVAGTENNEAVYCEEIPLSEMADRFGTPLYLYSQRGIDSAYRELDNGVRGMPHTICFAVKANGNLTILRHLARLGSGFDIVSGGELDYLRHLGVAGSRIVFSGVGKTREEIREALDYKGGSRRTYPGILLFNVESGAELDVLLSESEKFVRRGGIAPNVSIRVNPDVQAGGHPHISTGHHDHKFGLDWPAARALYLKHRDSKWIRWEGVSAHIGSQIIAKQPFQTALLRLAGFVRELRREGISLKFLDFGGGLGVRYTNEQPLSRTEYAHLVAKLVRPLCLHLLLEPGRTIIASAGVLLTRVLYTKENRGKTFVIVDAAMNDLLRPALYAAVHPITRVLLNVRQESETARADIVGPVCETGDCFLQDWPIGKVQPGDVLAIWGTGAYGTVLASNYNARPRAAEVLVQGRRARLIRRRETTRDLLRGQTLA